MTLDDLENSDFQALLVSILRKLPVQLVEGTLSRLQAESDKLEQFMDQLDKVQGQLGSNEEWEAEFKDFTGNLEDWKEERRARWIILCLEEMIELIRFQSVIRKSGSADKPEG